MLRLKRLSRTAPAIVRSFGPLQHGSHKTTNRFLDFYKLGSKDAIEKERARLADEMNRGYFADINELKKHGGKIAIANKNLTPVTTSVMFPAIDVDCPDGATLKLPIVGNNAHESNPPKATLICLSFRASAQAMIDTWSIPFFESFRNSSKVQLYEMSFIDSWLLSLYPIRRLLLKIMRKSNFNGEQDELQKRIVYKFGDHYYFRKELKILNLLTGYIFLVDSFGRIRWQGFGLATEDELSSLLSCTSLLLEDK
ncbi:uncharacterized protein LOC124920828 [Impatiens glandulifera]|uniref:uncharacterized protein LOC124920828 n=1 Tax=Impatiens glandulifera TaxID=253017 RepID=UPI001FB177CD|nr:uncharacterized protein LOC124920828 [Impatiens glandulifera]